MSWLSKVLLVKRNAWAPQMTTSSGSRARCLCREQLRPVSPDAIRIRQDEPAVVHSTGTRISILFLVQVRSVTRPVRQDADGVHDRETALACLRATGRASQGSSFQAA